MIKFNKHNVRNTETGDKARCHYDFRVQRADGREVVVILAKDYGNQLGKVFADVDVRNETDMQTDYFEKDRVYLFADHPLFAAAKQRAEANAADWQRRHPAARVW